MFLRMCPFHLCYLICWWTLFIVVSYLFCFRKVSSDPYFHPMLVIYVFYFFVSVGRGLSALLILSKNKLLLSACITEKYTRSIIRHVSLSYITNESSSPDVSFPRRQIFMVSTKPTAVVNISNEPHLIRGSLSSIARCPPRGRPRSRPPIRIPTTCSFTGFFSCVQRAPSGFSQLATALCPSLEHLRSHTQMVDDIRGEREVFIAPPPVPSVKLILWALTPSPSHSTRIREEAG